MNTKTQKGWAAILAGMGALACVPAGTIPSSGDGGTGPPAVASVSAPPQGASRTAPIVVTFTAPIDAESFAKDAIVLLPGAASQAFLSDLRNPPLSQSRRDDLVATTVALADDRLCASVAPLRPLAPEAPYVLAVSGALRDEEGRQLGDSFAWSFTTGPMSAGAPELAVRFPAGEAESPAAPTNLARVVVEFSEPVGGVDDDSLRMEGAETHVARAERWCEGCWSIEIDAPLAKGAAYAIVAGDAIRDADGEGPFGGEAGGQPIVRTGMTPDAAPPIIGAAQVEAAGGCLVGRWVTDEPATSALMAAFVPQFTLVHEVGVPVPAGSYAVWIESSDWADGRTLQGPIAIVLPETAAITITEVMANPAGAEPGQEWIEIVNLDESAVDLGGWRIADSTGEDFLPVAAPLDPGAAALIVGASYDPLEGSDPPPHPSAAIVRLTSAIGDGGLRNSGEPVRLIDADGRVVSSFRGIETAQGRSAVRVGACDVAASWIESAEGVATPGRP